jgi:hypothetical protein
MAEFDVVENAMFRKRSWRSEYPVAEKSGLKSVTLIADSNPVSQVLW